MPSVFKQPETPPTKFDINVFQKYQQSTNNCPNMIEFDAQKQYLIDQNFQLMGLKKKSLWLQLTLKTDRFVFDSVQ